MQIKIGFVHNNRELVIATDGEGSQDTIVSQLEEFLANGEPHATFTLEGVRGARYILVREQIAYVEVGAQTKNSVGFIN